MYRSVRGQAPFAEPAAPHFLLGLAVFGESFQPAQAVAFGSLWAALLGFGVEAILAGPRPPTPAPASAAPRRVRSLAGRAGRALQQEPA
jgi:hypothetical protein